MRRPTALVPPESPSAPSKTRRKKDMQELQALGEALVGLDPARLGALDLPERLADAIRAAGPITKHEGRRRQLQFVGRLMRDVDPVPIRAALERIQSLPRAERARFAAAERWRDRLLDDAQALEAFVAEHADVDRAALAAIIRAAHAERTSGRPPHQFRALFRAISRALAQRA